MKAYQCRPSRVTDAAWERGYLTPLELLRVAAWKFAKGLASLTLNTEDEIYRRTGEAMEFLRPWRGIAVVGLDSDVRWAGWRDAANLAIGWDAYSGEPASGLLALQGVGYPMASAILDILDADVWPVIDKWAVQTVFGKDAETEDWKHASAYVAYTRHLATKGAECWGSGLSIHQLDQKAMNASMPGGQLPADWAHAKLPRRGV